MANEFQISSLTELFDWLDRFSWASRFYRF